MPGVRVLLHAAFRADPVSRWLFPGEAHCEERHPRLQGAFLESAFRHGTAETTEDGAGVVLWFHHRDGRQTGAEELADALDAVDPGNPRLRQLGEAVGGRHPSEDHAYLQFIAVLPERQGAGLGGALLGRSLERCDAAALPAYLEASSARSCGLYERLGFRMRGEPVRLPGGPEMWPMWRPPR
nr:GNAT family N-acetyltransferase [Streptomyces boncukensis]